MVAPLSSPVRVLEVSESARGLTDTRPTTRVVPNRNPENSDRNRGTANGGVPSGNIGASRELNTEQRKAARITARADVPPAALGNTVRGVPESPAAYGRPLRELGAASAATFAPGGTPAVNASPAVRGTGRPEAASSVTPAAPGESLRRTPDPAPAAAPAQAPGERRVRVATPERAAATVTPPAGERALPQDRAQNRAEGVVRAEAAATGRETPPPSAPGPAAANAVERQRLADAYGTVPKDPALKISFFA